MGTCPSISCCVFGGKPKFIIITDSGVSFSMPGWKAVSHAELGNRADAEAAGGELLAIARKYWNGEGTCDDRSVVNWFLNSFPIRNARTIARLENGLKFAGLPV